MSLEESDFHRSAIQVSRKLLHTAEAILSSLERPYDTAENQCVKCILLSAKKRLIFFRNYYSCCEDPDRTQLAALDTLVSTLKTLCRDPRLKWIPTPANLPRNLPHVRQAPLYEELYKQYRTLKKLLPSRKAGIAPSLPPRDILPRSTLQELTATCWGCPDVLIGSVKSVAQFGDNINRKYYYTPAEYVTGELSQIRYIALYQSGRLFGSDTGIRYYGKVTKAKRLRRMDIDFPFNPLRGNEPYCAFMVEHWETLPNAIAVRDEGVYAPRFTYSLLLQNSAYTFELFSIRSDAAFRLMYIVNCYFRDGMAGIYSISESCSLCVSHDYFTVIDKSGNVLGKVITEDMKKYPRTGFSRLKKLMGER